MFVSKRFLESCSPETASYVESHPKRGFSGRSYWFLSIGRGGDYPSARRVTGPPEESNGLALHGSVGACLWQPDIVKLAVLQRIQIGADAQLGPRNRGDPVVIRPSRARQHYASDNQGDNRSVGKFRYKLLESSRPESSSETIRPAFFGWVLYNSGGDQRRRSPHDGSARGGAPV